MSFMGNVLAYKSVQPETEKSVEGNIRLDRELKIIKKFPGDVIQVEGGTKWQIDRTGERGSRVEIEEGDTVLMTKSTFPRKSIVKLYFINKKNRELGGTFISEA
jgi:NMD protein affecting ribosome stability and mRNA decay